MILKSIFLPFLLSAALAYALFDFSPEQWGLILTAWLITACSLHEIFTKLSKREKKDQEQIAQLTTLLQEAQRVTVQERGQAEKKLATVEQKAQKVLDEMLVNEKLLENLRATYLSVVHECRLLREGHAKLLADFQASDASRSAYLAELNRVRVENYQLSLFSEVPPPAAPVAPVVIEVPVLEKDAELERMHQQLRQQFEEKSEVLHETRKELFHVENQLLALQREAAQQAQDLPPSEAALIAHLQDLERECQDLQTQVDTLQEIISGFLPKKRTPKLKALRKESLQSSLRF
jgi:DNA repair exonuclease SbcCD ATPase subunit